MSWLIDSNGLIVEHAAVPEVSGPPLPQPGRSGGAAPGQIHTAEDRAVAAECERANAGLAWLKKEGRVQLVTGEGGGGGTPDRGGCRSPSARGRTTAAR